MSIDLSINSLGESFVSREDFATSMSRWYGHDLSWNDLPALHSDAVRRIMELLFRGDHQSELLAYQLAWIGTSAEQRPTIEKEIAHPIRTSNGWEIHPAGLKEFGKKFSSGCKQTWNKTCEVASEAWKATCEVAQKTCDTVKEFWEDHQKEIVQTTLPTTPLLEPLPPSFQPIPSQLSLEALYGEEYVSNLYRQFQLSDPYAQIATTPDPVSTLTPNQQFVQLIEKKLQEARDPHYINSLLGREERPNYNKQFVEHIEKRLQEPHDPNYIDNVLEPDYLPTMEIIKALFVERELASSALRNNYASSLSSHKPASPFREVPLLGYRDQSTIHFHCGISNTFSSIVEGGLQLNESLDKRFAVQPHLIHSSSLVRGLTAVGLEKFEAACPEIVSAGVRTTVPIINFQHAQIQNSIDYEIENLSEIARNIIRSENPNLKQVHVTFSNGGYVFNEALKQLPQEYRETIIVITAGTTAIIEDHLACKVYNVVGDKDKPSQLCNGGLSGIEETKGRGTTVYIIPQNETQDWVGGHYFLQPDYQNQISTILQNKIASIYEIY